MHRKTDIQELSIPRDDIECWERYPKHRWVYDLSRLFDAQGIKWSPYEHIAFPDRELNSEMYSVNPIIRQPGYIYIRKPEGRHLITEVHIIKGEIKNIRHFDPMTKNELENIVGEVELRISAFVTLHFQKFTGVITIDTYSNELFRIHLRPYINPAMEANNDVSKLIKRIYKRNDITITGPTDQVIHETLTS